MWETTLVCLPFYVWYVLLAYLCQDARDHSILYTFAVDYKVCLVSYYGFADTHIVFVQVDCYLHSLAPICLSLNNTLAFSSLLRWLRSINTDMSVLLICRL